MRGSPCSWTTHSLHLYHPGYDVSEPIVSVPEWPVTGVGWYLPAKSFYFVVWWLLHCQCSLVFMKLICTILSCLYSIVIRYTISIFWQITDGPTWTYLVSLIEISSSWDSLAAGPLNIPQSVATALTEQVMTSLWYDRGCVFITLGQNYKWMLLYVVWKQTANAPSSSRGWKEMHSPDKWLHTMILSVY